MVKEYEHLKVEDHGQVVICVLTNPPTHTFTSKSLMEVHDFLDQMEKRKAVSYTHLTLPTKA